MGTESGICALDGSFAVILDVDVNAQRFASPVNWMNSELTERQRAQGLRKENANQHSAGKLRTPVRYCVGAAMDRRDEKVYNTNKQICTIVLNTVLRPRKES